MTKTAREVRTMIDLTIAPKPFLRVVALLRCGPDDPALAWQVDDLRRDTVEPHASGPDVANAPPELTNEISELCARLARHAVPKRECRFEHASGVASKIPLGLHVAFVHATPGRTQ